MFWGRVTRKLPISGTSRVTISPRSTWSCFTRRTTCGSSFHERRGEVRVQRTPGEPHPEYSWQLALKQLSGLESSPLLVDQLPIPLHDLEPIQLSTPRIHLRQCSQRVVMTLADMTCQVPWPRAGANDSEMVAAQQSILLATIFVGKNIGEMVGDEEFRVVGRADSDRNILASQYSCHSPPPCDQSFTTEEDQNGEYCSPSIKNCVPMLPHRSCRTQPRIRRITRNPSNN